MRLMDRSRSAFRRRCCFHVSLVRTLFTLFDHSLQEKRTKTRKTGVQNERHGATGPNRNGRARRLAAGSAPPGREGTTTGITARTGARDGPANHAVGIRAAVAAAAAAAQRDHLHKREPISLSREGVILVTGTCCAHRSRRRRRRRPVPSTPKTPPLYARAGDVIRFHDTRPPNMETVSLFFVFRFTILGTRKKKKKCGYL